MGSSIPQFYSDYSFPPDFSDFVSASSVGGRNDGGAMWPVQESFQFDNGAFDIKPPESDIMSSVSIMLSYPDRVGVSDMGVPALPDFGYGSCGIAGVQNFGEGYRQDLCDFGEECSRFVSDCQSGFSTSTRDTLGTEYKPTAAAIENSNIKVGRYSVEERKDRILRYLRKRNQRNFNKTIKYACRKTLADRRVRVRGRFARNNNELSEEELVMKKNNNAQEPKELYYDDPIQIKHDDDDWLQEAMESLIYLPYIA